MPSTTEYPTFTRDVLGRYVCNTFDEALVTIDPNARAAAGLNARGELRSFAFNGESRMKMSPLALFVCALIAGCQTPVRPGCPLPRLDFIVHYTGPTFWPASTTPISTTGPVALEAGRCVFVASPFRVVASASDPGGISSITIGPSAFFGSLVVRDADTLSIPTPDVRTQRTSTGETYPNPGSPPDSSLIRLSFLEGRAYRAVTLHGVLEFAPGAEIAALQATARNFIGTGEISQVYNFYLRRAGNRADEQPGMECTLP